LTPKVNHRAYRGQILGVVSRVAQEIQAEGRVVIDDPSTHGRRHTQAVFLLTGLLRLNRIHVCLRLLSTGTRLTYSFSQGLVAKQTRPQRVSKMRRNFRTPYLLRRFKQRETLGLNCTTWSIPRPSLSSSVSYSLYHMK